MNIIDTSIVNKYTSMAGLPTETVEQEINITLEELDNITTDEQKLALWQQLSDAIAAARNS